MTSGSAIVTGVAGFLGSRIARTLVTAGYDVLGIDRATVDIQGVRAVEFGLPDDSLAGLLASERPKLVVNAAGPASVAASLSAPLDDFAGSVGVTAALLEAVRVNSPEARVILLSSAAVYGDPERLPVPETACLAPLSPYGFHKVLCETLAREYHRIYGLRTCSLRIFSAYGAGLARQLLWDVCERAVSGDTLRLFGTGGETRDFIHGDDVAEAVRVVAERAPLAGEAYNTASGVETSVHEVAERLRDAVAPDASIEFSGEVRPGDPLHWRADISALRGLGFAPVRDIDGGLEEYAAWYRARREQAR